MSMGSLPVELEPRGAVFSAGWLVEDYRLFVHWVFFVPEKSTDEAEYVGLLSTRFHRESSLNQPENAVNEANV